jgi:putative peptidoglycan lipid II flippase
VLSILPARSIDQGIDYFNNIVEATLAGRLFEGAVRAYTQATTLHMVPITLIGVAISTAAFPKMTERLSQGRTDLFRKELQSVIRVIVWLALPAGMIAFFCRGYLVNFLFNGGEPVVAGLLGILSFAIVFRSIYHIASRSFYAQQDTRTPLYISVFVIALNILLAVLFIMKLDLGIYGLAWAQTIVALVEVVILFTIMSWRIPKLFGTDFLHALSRMVMATGITSIVTYLLVKQFDLVITYKSFWATFPKFALIATLSLICYVGVSKWFKLREAESVIAQVRRLIFAQAK